MPLQHLPLFVRAGIAHLDLEQKTVELRFGQRISAFKVDGILRGENSEPSGQRPRDAVAGHLALFHAFQQRGLGAGWHAVDFVDQQQVGEDRAGVKGECIRARSEDGGAQNVGGHQVGRSLHALEAEPQQPAHRFHDQRLGDAGHAFEQRMPLREHGHQNFADHLVLPCDHASQLRARTGQQLLRGLQGCAWRLRVLFNDSLRSFRSPCLLRPAVRVRFAEFIFNRRFSLSLLDPKLRRGG